ncbi:hypothetical protein OAA90_04360 [Salibacteraceae bacterium]|jgi:hypothetical protein|nr:hypothetical protein [Crocinitomicaceae bacterium]MDB9725593.1 hypothetical protein [Salibacteraceae bacterium]MDC1204332.1 hypothetical protein [Salibacteraceae bacterium]|tara:strand:+ start:249 stop:632 length:384 start_codon:yes stop_codon:yes gene_type:complete
MNRDFDLIQLRPQVQFNTKNIKETEAFQNKTLRPILKFQNQFILFNFKNNIKIKEPLFNAYNLLEQKRIIRKIMKEDLRFKNHLTSAMVSFFTIEELQFYNANAKEVSKRITNMILQRVDDQISFLY